MNVASLELCKELCELSGWGDTHFAWAVPQGEECRGMSPLLRDRIGSNYAWHETPAYDLGYLLRRLPEFIDWKGLQHNLSLYPSGVLGGWVAKYENAPLKTAFQVVADTPENAAAKLCIELFKQKILTRES